MVRCSLGNNHRFQSETPRFYVSNVIFAMNGSLKYYENIENMFCGVPLSDLSRNMEINRRGVMTWIYDAEIVFWRHSYLSKHRIGDVAILLLLMILKWMCNQGNFSTTWYGFITTGQRRKFYEIYYSPLIFTFYLNGGTSVLELFLVVIFQ